MREKDVMAAGQPGIRRFDYFLQILGKGSFGLVIRGRWRGREVAIKVFQTESERSAFTVELRQLSRVDHPNIIRLYIEIACVYVQCVSATKRNLLL